MILLYFFAVVANFVSVLFVFVDSGICCRETYNMIAAIRLKKSYSYKNKIIDTNNKSFIFVETVNIRVWCLVFGVYC